MPLTLTQNTALKAFIEGDPSLSLFPATSNGAFLLAAELQNDSTAVVWRTSVLESEYTSDESGEGTNWDWSEYISRSVGEKAGYARMFSTGSINPSKENIRQGFADVFSGGAAGSIAQ